jgi:hypothetical protein
MGRMNNYARVSWYKLRKKTYSTRFKLYIVITTCKILSLTNTHVMLCVVSNIRVIVDQERFHLFE